MTLHNYRASVITPEALQVHIVVAFLLVLVASALPTYVQYVSEALVFM
jgi:hypothetical protein